MKNKSTQEFQSCGEIESTQEFEFYGQDDTRTQVD